MPRIYMIIKLLMLTLQTKMSVLQVGFTKISHAHIDYVHMHIMYIWLVTYPWYILLYTLKFDISTMVHQANINEGGRHPETKIRLI